MMFEQYGRRQWVSGAPQEATKENVSVIDHPETIRVLAVKRDGIKGLK